jgi:hypothetical protein
MRKKVVPGSLVTPAKFGINLGGGAAGSSWWTKFAARVNQGETCLVLAVLRNEVMVLTPAATLGWHWSSAFVTVEEYLSTDFMWEQLVGPGEGKAR